MYSVLEEAGFRQRYGRNMGDISPFEAGIPLVEAEDRTLEEIYYFRWHTYCQQIKKTPLGYVVTEFLDPVPWAGIYNTINCPAGHHFAEGRWLHDRKYLKDYAAFWFTPEAEPRKYSFWAAAAILDACRVWGDYSAAEALYPRLKENYGCWEQSHGRENGLFYQTDNNDGMEYSISGPGLRPTINSYMYADALALAEIAERLKKPEEAALFREKARNLRERINGRLWDPKAEFYKTLAEDREYTFADVREEVGYVPWCWNIPEQQMSAAWRFLLDENHFAAPYGPTTAERCHPEFMKEHPHECLWNGPSWPFATTQTLTAMANLLRHYKQSYVNKSDYWRLLRQYAACHYIEEDGEKRPFLDEDLDPFTGRWLAREILRAEQPPRPDRDRGRDYNHSAFCDLVLSGLAGLRLEGECVVAEPLFEPEDLAWFCADGVRLGDRFVTLLWDRDGTRYGKGPGLRLLVDGVEKAAAPGTGALRA